MPQPLPNAHYDYIISGAGAAGLSLLARMISSGKFEHKSILLVDKEPKINNDRTWCFWEKEKGFFESVVYKSWPVLWFHGAAFSRQFNIEPFRYKMIRGIDFYNHCFSLINAQTNITILYGNVEEIFSDEKETFLILDHKKFTAEYIFNSILFNKPVLDKNEFYLLQHFKGWIIETDKPVFVQDQATLMDFRVSQDNGTAFVYVMPFSNNKALVEYTMFSEQLLEQTDYDKNLHNYISGQLNSNDYKVTGEEFGIIPMTNYRFTTSDHNIINIGTAGGQTKASTGYTFMSIQKNAAAILQDLLMGKKPLKEKNTSARYHFYDSVLLNVLATGKLAGDKIFTRLFNKNHPHLIFNFLDNNTSILQDIQLISSLPTIPFLKAGMQELF